jgi:glutathione S-transferase
VLLYDSPVSGNCYKVRLLLTVRFWLTFARDPPPAAEIAARQAAGDRALDTLETHLGRRDFLVGDGYTIADIALYAYTHVAGEGGFDLGVRPAIGRWLSRVAAQPGHVPISA